MNKHLFITALLFSCLSLQLWGSPFSASKLAITENKGQITDQFGQPRADIHFKVATGTGVNIFISNTGLHYQWNAVEQQPDNANANFSVADRSDLSELTVNSYRMDVALLNANPNATVIKEQQVGGQERYYTATVDPLNNTVYSYQKVTYKNVYPHIDWVLYIEPGEGSQSSLKYDFVVHPGGKVSDIQLQFKGASKLALQADGSLQATTPMGHIRENAPYSYVASAGSASASASSKAAAVEVASRFTLTDNIMRFETAAYEGTLVIDPVLEWATYYGGEVADAATGTLVDSQGNVYIIGNAMSTTNIATTGAHQTTFGGGLYRPDAYIAKFTPLGVRIWATYYGGDRTETASGVALDGAGNIYLTGSTGSTSAIATAGSHQSTLGGGTYDNDAFLVKFDTSGQRLWGTYYGGPGVDESLGITTDADGNIYMTGHTRSASDIATTGSFQPANHGDRDAFLVKFDTSGQRLWGTYFGGSESDWGDAIACDPSNDIYVGGRTASTSGIATANSHQSVNAGGNYDAFIAKFNPSGGREWATYYGGAENNDDITSLKTDAAGYVYIAGNTQSTSGIATAGSYQDTHGGGNPIDAFLVKFNGAGERQWGTYYGGTDDDRGGPIAIDEQGNIFFTGQTKSPNNMATSGSLQPALNGTSFDAFIVKFDSTGQREWGSYLGGTGEDGGNGLSVDNWGNMYVAGYATGSGFPVTPGSHQDTFLASLYTSFLVKICGSGLPQGIINGIDSMCPGGSAVYSVPSVPHASYIWTLPDGSSGSSDSSSILVHMGNNTGMLTVQMVACNDTSNVISKEITIFTPVEAIITIDEFTLNTLNAHDTYQWLLNGVAITGATNREYNILENGDYKVATTNDGCIDTSDLYTVDNYGTSINDKEWIAGQVTIYPNPTQNELYITSPIPVSLTMTSIEGRTLIYKKAADKLSLQGLSAGIYLLHITDREGLLIKTEKIIKR